jgi:hypothetical protein
VQRRVWVGLAVCALLVGAGALRLQQLRTRARTEVTRVLHDALGLRARVRDADLDFASLSLLAHGLELDDAAGQRVLSARELRVRTSLRGLLAGRFELLSVRVSGATLRASLTGPGWLASAAQHRPWRLGALSITDSSLLLELPDVGSVQLGSATLELSSAAGDKTRTLQLRVRAGRAALLRDGAAVAQGRLRLQGTLRDDGGPAHAQGRLWLEHAQLAGRALDDTLELAWSSDAGRIGLRGTLGLGAAVGTLAVEGTFGLGAALTSELRLQPQGLHLRAALARFGLSLPQADAVLDGRIELRGSLVPFVLAGPAALDARELRVSGLQRDGSAAADPLFALARLRATADARLDAAGVVLEGLRLEPATGALQGSARVGWNGALDAKLSGTELSLADFSPLAGNSIAGRGRAELVASGALGAPELRLSTTVEGGAFAGFELGHTVAVVRLQDAGRSLLFEQLEIAGGERRLSADGTRLRFDGGLVEAASHMRIARLPLADLYRLLGAADDPLLSRLQGGATGDAELSYVRASDAGKLELKLALGLQATDVDGYRFDRGHLRARIAIPDAARGLGTGALTLEQLALEAADGRLALQGKLERGALAMTVVLDKLPLDRLPWLRAHLPLLDGRVQGKAELSGSSGDTRARAELTLGGLTVAGRQLGQARLHASLQGRKDEAQPQPSGLACNEGPAALASGALGGSAAEAGATAWLVCGDGLAGRLRVDLGLGAAPERRVRGTLALDGFDLSPFLPEQQKGSPSHGKLSAALALEGGGLAVPARVSGRLRVSQLELGDGDLAVASPAPFELRVHEGKLELEDAKLVGPSLTLALGASGSLQQDPRLLADGVAVAGLFARDSAPFAEASGDVGVHLSLNPGAEPLLRAEAEASEVLVRFESGLAMRKLHGKLVLDGTHVRLEDVATSIGGGTLRVGGQLALQGLHVASYDLSLQAERVSFEPQPKLEVTLDADSRLQSPGGGAPPTLTGSVRVARLLYGRHIQLPEALTSLNRQDRQTLAEYEPARDRLRFDVELTHGDSLRVRNNFLDAELEMTGPERKLRVVGSDQRFGVLGKLAIMRGRVLFHGDEFQVTRGEIGFDDERRVAPSFDVRAVAERRKRADTNIVFLAHGTRDSFDLRVRCDVNDTPVAAPPFTCDYAHDKLRCDSFEQLTRLWTCQPKTELSSADATR